MVLHIYFPAKWKGTWHKESEWINVLWILKQKSWASTTSTQAGLICRLTPSKPRLDYKALTLATWKCSERSDSSIPDESVLWGELPRAVARRPISTPRKLNLRIFWFTFSISASLSSHRGWCDVIGDDVTSSSVMLWRHQLWLSHLVSSASVIVIVIVIVERSNAYSLLTSAINRLVRTIRLAASVCVSTCWLQQLKAQLLLLLLVMTTQSQSPTCHSAHRSRHTGTVSIAIVLCRYARLFSFFRSFTANH